jgi:hypothetical protein
MKILFTGLRRSNPRQFANPVDLVVEGCLKRPGLFEMFSTAKRSTKWNEQPVSGLR